MPDRIVHRTKVAEGLAILATAVALVTSMTVFFVNQRAIRRVNNSRQDIALQSCQEQNARHDRTIKELDDLLNKAVKAQPNNAKQIRTSRAGTVLLINALAPKQKCKALVTKRFGK